MATLTPRLLPLSQRILFPLKQHTGSNHANPLLKTINLAEMLFADHEPVKTLFEKYERITGKLLGEEIFKDLQLHGKLEQRSV